MDENKLLEILSTCKGIKNLALVMDARWPSVDPIFATMRPRRLCIYMAAVDPWRPMYTLVTHLNIMDYIPLVPDDKLSRWLSFLALLPALTHLSLYHGFTVVKDVLASCKKLEILICLHLNSISHRKAFLSVDDVRLIYMRRSWRYLDDWVTGTKGGMDFWARADAKFIAKKRR
ncbi:hypothetical protein B0H19DRAFT_1263849 [Mycena capillaripes]|nr:hypothetical protein B0H19DRAFT_1263849 [Mycena capillaripes]